MTRHYTREGDPRLASPRLAGTLYFNVRASEILIPFVKDAGMIRRAVRSNEEDRCGRVINADEWSSRRTEYPSDRKIPPRTWNSGFPVFARPASLPTSHRRALNVILRANGRRSF